MSRKSTIEVGSRVRHRDPRTCQHGWHGTIVHIFSQTADVIWDELKSGPVEIKPTVGHSYYRFPDLDRLPLAVLEPIPSEDRTVVLVDGGQCLPEAAIAFAFNHLTVCPRQVWASHDLASMSSLQAWASSHGIPVAVHDDWQAMVEHLQLAQWPGAGLAIADGNKNDTSRHIVSALRQRKISTQVINLAPLLSSNQDLSQLVQVLNLKLHTPGSRSTYIGREHPSSGLPCSPLHNPYKLGQTTRVEACDQFERQVLYPAIEARAGPVWDELARLRDLLLDAIAAGEHIELLCHCAPQPCHGDRIAATLKQLGKAKLFD